MIQKASQILLFFTIISIEFLAFTTNNSQTISTGWDKLNHFLAFMVLYILISLGYKRWSTMLKLLLLFIFALHIEIVQYFIPGREFSLLDIIADMIGVGVGALILYFT